MNTASLPANIDHDVAERLLKLHIDDFFAVPQGVPHVITDDGGICKVIMKSGDVNKPVPSFAKGSNAKFHYVVHSFPLPVEAAPLAKPSSSTAPKKKLNAVGSQIMEILKVMTGPERAAELKKSKKELRRLQRRARGHDSSSSEEESEAEIEKCHSRGHSHVHGHGHAHSHSQEDGHGDFKAKEEKPFDKTQRHKLGDSLEMDPETPFELRLGRGFSFPFFEMAVKTMRPGERAKFLCTPQHTEGYPQLEMLLRKEKKKREEVRKGNINALMAGRCAATYIDDIEENNDLIQTMGCPLEIEIELVEILEPGEYEPMLWEMTLEQKVNEIPILQERAKKFFQSGKIKEATDRYMRGIGILESVMMNPRLTDREREIAFQKKEAAKAIAAQRDAEEFNRRRVARIAEEMQGQKHTEEEIAARIKAFRLKQGSTKSDMSTPAPSSTSASATAASADHELGALPEVTLADIQGQLDLFRLNYVACLLTAATPDDLKIAVQEASKVLEKNPQNMKALLRRAKGHIRIGRDLDKAKADLQTLENLILAASSQDPEICKIRSELENEQSILSRKMASTLVKEKKMFQNMFGNH